ncbi:MAG: YceI family protein [Candidatus Sericytochromatia bacterium]
MEASAKSYYLKFNEKESKINFYVNSTLHNVTGEARKFKGFISIKGEGTDVEKADGLLEITADSLFTNQSQRDTRLKSEVLSVLKFPLIKFKVNNVKITSNKIEQDGTAFLKLLGPLTIRNTTKNVEIPVKVKMTPNSTIVEGKYIINFKEYNVPDPSLPIIGKVDENIPINFVIKAY